WHLSPGRGAQAGHSPPHSFYFGQGEGPNGGGNISVGNTAGSITSAPIALPNSTLTLSFNYVLDSYNSASVQVSNDGGATFTNIAIPDYPYQLPLWSVWRPFSMDLSAYAGQTIQLRFSFDAKW